MMNSVVIDNVIAKWRQDKARPLLPKEEARVIAELNKTGRSVSQDIIDLYCVTGGMEEGYSDSFMWSLWSLDRIVSGNLNYSRPYILFADFMIHSYFYCFKYEDTERSSVYVDYFNEEEPHRVADSVEEFFGLYLSDPRKIEID